MRFISHWDSKEAEARSTRWRHVMASFLYSMAASRASMASSSWNSVRSSCGPRAHVDGEARLPAPTPGTTAPGRQGQPPAMRETLCPLILSRQSARQEQGPCPL